MWTFQMCRPSLLPFGGAPMQDRTYISSMKALYSLTVAGVMRSGQDVYLTKLGLVCFATSAAKGACIGCWVS